MPPYDANQTIGLQLLEGMVINMLFMKIITMTKIMFIMVCLMLFSRIINGVGLIV